MLRHLTRENSVAGIFVVSRDGGRFPGTLAHMIDIYKKGAFLGDSYLLGFDLFQGLVNGLTILLPHALFCVSATGIPCSFR